MNDDKEEHGIDGLSGARLAVVGALGVALLLIVLSIFGGDDVRKGIDGTTVVLLVMSLALLFALVSPRVMSDLIGRIGSIKLPGGIEIGLQAVSRAERLQMPPETDDRVLPDEERPRGTAVVEFQAVSDKLKERLRFIRDAHILEMDSRAQYSQVVARIDEAGLLRRDELDFVHDILGRVEDEIGRLPAQLREQFLDGAWRFAWRFGSLVFERRVRRTLAQLGWHLFDFQQSWGHRPDFLAFRNSEWMLVAARVARPNVDETYARLSKSDPPFNASRTIVVPRDGNVKECAGGAAVRVRTLSELTSN